MSEFVPEIVEIDDDIGFTVLDLDGTNAFLRTGTANGAGVALMLMGELKPGSLDAILVAGEPIGAKIVETANTSLKKAGIVVMRPYFDIRHAEYLVRLIMKRIAESKGLDAKDQRTNAELAVNEVPYADIARIEKAAEMICARLDRDLDFPVIGRATKTLH